MCENHDALLKAKPPDDHDIWGPHESPFIRDLIERWTSTGLERFGQTSAELLLWVAGKMHKPGPPTIKPGPMLRWAAGDLERVEHFLETLPPEAFTIDEWMLVVDYLFQRYLPADALMQEAQWQTLRASMMGRVQSNIAAMSAASAAHIAMAMPATIPDISAQFGISETQRAAIEFGQARCAQYVTNVTDGLRGRIKLAITDWQEQKFLGTPSNIAKQDLQSKLLDQFGEANRDWRRIAITEAGEAANQGFIGAQPFGTQVKRIEQYRGACPFCASIDGNIYTVVSPDKPDKDGDTEVWAGKNNIGRSAAPRKRTADGWVNRVKNEMLWAPAGLAHPHCFIDPKTPIYTSDGWRPIASIRNGELVLTHRGRFREVNWVLDGETYSGDVITLHVEFDGRNKSPSPTMTPEHPVLTERGWVPAGEVAIGDKVVTLAKRCPTCGEKFANPKFESVNYCSNKCIPKSGANQFSTQDLSVREAASEVTRQANIFRMRGMTIEQRRELTSKARSVCAGLGYQWLLSAEGRRKGGVAAAKTNYAPSEVERMVASEIAVLGGAPVLQERINSTLLDARGRRRYWWADIALPDQKIAVEIDGEPWHGRLSEDGRDARRDADLAAQGWMVMRFSHSAAKANPSAIAQEVMRVAINHSGEYEFTTVDVVKVAHRNVKSRTLYNFGVDEDESYIVRGGLVVHNCRGRWVRVNLPTLPIDAELSSWLRQQTEARKKNGG